MVWGQEDVGTFLALEDLAVIPYYLMRDKGLGAGGARGCRKFTIPKSQIGVGWKRKIEWVEDEDRGLWQV